MRDAEPRRRKRALSLSLSLSFCVSAGLLGGHVVTLRPSARPTTQCFFNWVVVIGVSLTAVLNDRALSLSLPLFSR